MTAYIAEVFKNCPTWFHFQAKWPRDKTMSHKLLQRPWESVGTDIFIINNKHYLCGLDYQSKFLVVKQVEGLSIDNLRTTCQSFFLEYGLPIKIVSDVSTNCVSEKFRNSANYLAYNKQYNHHKITKVTEKQKHT